MGLCNQWIWWLELGSVRVILTNILLAEASGNCWCIVIVIILTTTGLNKNPVSVSLSTHLNSRLAAFKAPANRSKISRTVSAGHFSTLTSLPLTHLCKTTLTEQSFPITLFFLLLLPDEQDTGGLFWGSIRSHCVVSKAQKVYKENLTKKRASDIWHPIKKLHSIVQLHSIKIAFN